MTSTNTSIPPTPTTSNPSSSFVSTSNPPPQSASKPLGPRPRAYDTGFREPFSDIRNTTLRHPSSIPSTTFTPQSQIQLLGTEKSRRLRFRAKHRHSRGASLDCGNLGSNGAVESGGIVLEDEDLYCGLQERTATEVDGFSAGREWSEGDEEKEARKGKRKVRRVVRRLVCHREGAERSG